jgi:hypothetical protein
MNKGARQLRCGHLAVMAHDVLGRSLLGLRLASIFVEFFFGRVLLGTFGIAAPANGNGHAKARNCPAYHGHRPLRKIRKKRPSTDSGGHTHNNCKNPVYYESWPIHGSA